MAELKRSVALTDDNWRDYFSFHYPESLVAGMQIPDNGFDCDSPEVTRLIQWVAEQNTHPNSRLTYTITRHDAALVLDLVAGRPPV